MNVLTYAMYRAARCLMTEAEVYENEVLARDADAGNPEAASVLRSRVVEILRDGKRRDQAHAVAAD